MRVQSDRVCGADKGGCFNVGCLIAAGFVGILVLVAVFIFMKGKRDLEPVVGAYLAAVDEGDYDAAWGLVGERWRAAQSREEFTAFEKSVRGALGAFKDRTMTGVHINSNSSGSTARVVYSGEFEKGAATVTFTMSKAGDRWLIDGVHYGSPLLASLAVCPKCGKRGPPGAKFCPGCGTGLAAGAGATPSADPADDEEGF